MGSNSGFKLGAEEVVVNGPKVAFKVFGFNVTETVILSWVVMAVIIGLVLFMTHNMSKDHPSKKQIVAEWIVETVNGMVRDSMGSRNLVYAPYMATIFSFSICGSLISVLGLRPVTGDFSVTLTWALMTFFMIQYAKIKNDGVLGYIVGFSKPIALLTPINIISELATPVSMSIRHFGNVASGIVITQLLYYGSFESTLTFSPDSCRHLSSQCLLWRTLVQHIRMKKRLTEKDVMYCIYRRNAARK